MAPPRDAVEFQAYLNTITYFDGVLAELFRLLDERGFLKNTVVLLVGDHGEAFGEHGKRQHDDVLWEEGVHVPLLLHGPRDLVGPPRRVGGLRQLMDLVPTIGWEAVREGVDDHRYITTLSHLIRRAEAAGLKADSKRAQRVLKELADKIDVNGYLAGIQSGHASKRRLGTHYDRTSPQGNIAKGDYNRFRHKIADEILRLQRGLKD